MGPGRYGRGPLVSSAPVHKELVLLPVLDRKRGKGGRRSARSTESERSPQARLEEAAGLAAAIDLDVAASGLDALPAPPDGVSPAAFELWAS